VAQDDEDEQDGLSLEASGTGDILSAVEKVRASLSPHCSILMSLPSFEKLSVLYDLVPNANRVGSVKLLHHNSISTMTIPLNGPLS